MKKTRKEVIDVPGVSKHLKKEGIPLNPVIRAGDFVFVSGLTPMDRRTGKIPLVTVDKQARQVLDNMKVCLEAAGSSLERLVQVRAMIYDRIEYDALNRVYRQYVPQGPPARTVWSVRIIDAFKVQLDAVAVI
jgi:2-iminobutanoate/2-iminopropanoate deaminase